MGVLQAAGAMNSDATPMREPEPVDSAPQAAEPEAPEPKVDRSEFVPLSKLEPRKPDSRRGRAEAAIEERFKAYDDERKRERESYETRLREQEQHIAQMRGHMEAVRQPPAPQGPPPQDPAAMHREALKALDEGRSAEYHELWRKAVVAESQAAAREQLKTQMDEYRKSMPQQLDPFTQTLLSKHDNVAAAGERGARAVMLKEAELELYGVPRGPQRTIQAFKLADQMLASNQSPTPPRYSQESAQALSGVPSGRTGSGGSPGGEAGVRLSELQLEVAKASGMTPAEFVKWSNPQKYFGK